MRATNDEGDGDWSMPASGTTANSLPVFSPATATRSVAENSATGTNVGAALPAATDTDTGDTLTYSLGGADAGSFSLDTTTLQLSVGTGTTLDYEDDSSYTVTMTADDGNGGTDTLTVTITITDVNEPPSAPAAPTVTAVPGSLTSLSVSWTAPANAGRPDITSYDVQYREGNSGAWSDGPQNVTATSATLTGLTENTSYQVQVRATNDEGDSGWSTPGSGATSDTTAVEGNGIVEGGIVFADGTSIADLPRGATIDVRLVDVSKTDGPEPIIARQICTVGQGICTGVFALDYDEDAIDPRNAYALITRIEHQGRLIYINDTVHFVITSPDPFRTNPEDRDVEVVAVP